MYLCKCKTIDGYIYQEAYGIDEYHYNIDTEKFKDKEYDTFMTFDIETSRYDFCDEKSETFMYIWQACIDNDVIFGRTWDEFLKFVYRISDIIKKKIVIYVHNLAYEFQFMKTFFRWENIFSIDEHVVLKAVCDKLEFRCSYKLCNMNLQKFIENTPGHFYIKGKDDLDYSILRTPSTELKETEYGYCYNDVRGLYHSIEHLLEEDTLKSIPLTSTGYVRRDCRKAMTNQEDRKIFKKSKLDLKTYLELKECFRGGNTASSRFHTNTIINNVSSYDISSSYPYVMMTCEFPFGKFLKASIETMEELDYYNNKYCTIGKYYFTNIRLKKETEPIPYISYSKCQKIDREAICYNGRVMEASFLSTRICNIDFNIIKNMYDWDEMYVEDFKYSKKKLLSKNLRNEIMKFFRDKTLLKGIDEQFYFYMKQKNKLNAIFGMMVSSIVHDIYNYEIKENRIVKYESEEQDKLKELEKYYKSFKSFLSYQCGIWVTAYARQRLQQLIDIIGIDVVYCDTDSVKFIGNYDVEINKLNEEVYRIAKEVDVPFNICDVYIGNEYIGDVYMGVWDREKPYDRFITLGAKKYAYEQKGELGVTVSGLNKENAPIELKEKGGLEAFKNHTVFKNSGRVTVEYHHKPTHILKINNEEILTGSYINMFETTYTLGITGTMLNIIDKTLLV